MVMGKKEVINKPWQSGIKGPIPLFELFRKAGLCISTFFTDAA
jgi:hypothetical protein